MMIYSVQVKVDDDPDYGPADDDPFEVSAIRDDDAHGAVSWGWPSETKIIIGDDSGLSQAQAKELADVICQHLNANGGFKCG